MMEQNNTSEPKAHAANSRPEIELSLKEAILNQMSHLGTSNTANGFVEVDPTSIEYVAEGLCAFVEAQIAQEADKLANKRVREVLERLKALSEVQRRDTPSYGIVYDEQIDEELQKLDKGDSHE